MDGMHAIIFVLLGVFSCGCNSVTSVILEETVRPGDNVTLYCDCKTSTGVYIVWYKNCSQENHPTLVLPTHKLHMWINNFPRFKFEKNNSSDSLDLVITNITTSDEGLYYCGTKERKVDKKEKITPQTIYTYSNTITKLTVTSIKRSPDCERPPQSCDLCWKLLFSLIPTISVFSAFLASFFVYLHCQRTAWKSQDCEKRHDLKRQTDETQGEDVCYAALEIRSASQRPKKKKKTIQSSDFSTYSAINTSRE